MPLDIVRSLLEEHWLKTGKWPKDFAQIEPAFLNMKEREFPLSARATYTWRIAKRSGGGVRVTVVEHSTRPQRSIVMSYPSSDPRQICMPWFVMDQRTNDLVLFDADWNLAHQLAIMLIRVEHNTGSRATEWSQMRGDHMYRHLLRMGCRRRLSFRRLVEGGKDVYRVTLKKSKEYVDYPVVAGYFPGPDASNIIVHRHKLGRRKKGA